MNSIFTRFSIFLILVFASSLNSQSIKDNIQRDTLIHLYSLDIAHVRYIINSGDSLNLDTSWLYQNPYKNYSYKVKFSDSLDYGTYMISSIEGNKVSSSVYSKKPYNLRMRAVDKDMIFYFRNNETDTLIRDAVVWIDNTLINYDSSYGGYSINLVNKKNKDIKLIIQYGGNTYYELYNYNSPYFQSYKNGKHQDINSYGYSVLNKPLYKHGDTLKFKAYLLDNKKGCPINKKIMLKIVGPKINYTTKLKSINKGTYEFDWIVPDTMQLDATYKLRIFYKIKGNTINRDLSFRVEEYKLDQSEISIYPTKNNYLAGEDIKLKVKTTDVNGMPLADTRVKIFGKINKVTDIYQDTMTITHQEQDSLFYLDTFLSYGAEHELVIPTENFPNAKMLLYFTSNIVDDRFEIHNFTHYVNYDAIEYSSSLIQNRDTLEGKFFVYSKEVEKELNLKTYSQGKLVDSIIIKTPFKYKLRENITSANLLYHDILLQHVEVVYDVLDITNFQGNRKTDSFNVSIKFPFDMPVHYRIYKDDKIIYSGQAQKIDYKLHDETESTYRVVYTHDLNKNIVGNFYQYTFLIRNKQVKITNNLPETAFPGQKLPLEITVKDAKGNPLEEFNLASYSVNDQFKNYIDSPTYYVPQRMKDIVDIKPPTSPLGDLYSNEVLFQKNFSLDKYHVARYNLYKNEYYKLKYPPSGVQILSFDKQNAITEYEVAIVSGNDIYNPKYIKIDNELKNIPSVYNYHISNLIDSGLHSLMFRTFDKAISMSPINFESHKKYIIVISIDSLNKSKKRPNILSVIDSLNLYEPSKKESIEILSKLLAFHEFTFSDSLIFENNHFDENRILQSRSTTSLHNFLRRIDQYNEEVYYIGPFNSLNVNILKDDVKYTLSPGPKLYSFDGYKGFVPRDIDAEAIKNIPYNDVSINIPNLVSLAYPDTLQPVEPVMQEMNRTNNPPLKRPAMSFQYSPQNNETMSKKDDWITIFMFGKRRQNLNSLWILNKGYEDISYYQTNLQINNLYRFNVGNDSVDMYLFSDRNELHIDKNMNIPYRANYYINLDYVKFENYDEGELTEGLSLYKKLNRKPILPFYYTPQESETLTMSDREFLNQNNKAYLSGTVLDESINPIPVTFIILEKGGVFYRGAISNQNGEFEFMDLTPDRYDIKIYNPQYTLKFYYNIPVGGKYQQDFTTKLTLRSKQNPITERIEKDYRMSLFEYYGDKNKLTINVYDFESRQLLQNSEIDVKINGNDYKVKNQVPFFYDELPIKTMDISVKNEGYNEYRFEQTNLNIKNEQNIDLFLRKSYTSSQVQKMEFRTIAEKKLSETDIQYNKEYANEIRGRIMDEEGQPVAYASVVIVEDKEGKIPTGKGARTDAKGYYVIKGLADGNYNIMAKTLGRPAQIVTNIAVTHYQGAVVNFVLKKDENLKEQNIIITQNRTNTSKTIDNYSPKERVISANEVSEAPRMYAEVSDVKGDRSESETYFVDGVKVTGLNTPPSSLHSVEVMTSGIPAKYGEPNTYSWKSKADSTGGYDDMFEKIQNSELSNKIRKIFSDEGFWEPTLITDANGKVKTEIQLPDNITKWRCFTIGMGEGYYYGLKEQYIKAFKPVQTILNTPQYLRLGDKINLTSTLTNYLSDPINCTIYFQKNSQKLGLHSISLKDRQTDSISISADSLQTFEVSSVIEYEDKYRDAEQKKVEVMDNLMTLYSSKSIYLENDTNFVLKFDENTEGYMTFSNRVFENILYMIQDLKNYEYGCLEQTSSKLKALVYEEQIKNTLGVKVNNGKEINKTINAIIKMQHKNGSFGWWEGSNEDINMTTYALESLLLRLSSSNFNLNNIRDYLVKQIDKTNSTANLYAGYVLISNKMMDKKYFDLSKYDPKNLNLKEKVYYYKIKDLKGEKVSDQEWYKLVIEFKNPTQNTYRNFFYDPTATILNSYVILKGTSAEKQMSQYYERELKSGNHLSNLNTFSKASLIEALISNATLTKKEVRSDVRLNNQKVDTFPSKMEIKASAYSVKKSGAPVWLNIAESKKVLNPQLYDSFFNINTNMDSSNMIRGKKYKLDVDIYSYQTRDYVMIEIPIPAGVVIRDKPQLFGNDHIEYFEDKIVVFVEKMNQGNSIYSFDLEPIFSGEFNVPPTKVSLMYYPHIYGNTTSNKVTIK